MQIDYQTACFLASLPHRQSFYKQAGWQNTRPPGSSDFQWFLNQFFSIREQNLAWQQASKCKPKHQSFPNRGERGWISIWHADYPLPLRHIFDPPPVLFFQLIGDLYPASDSSFLSMVGTRRPHQVCNSAIQKRLSEWHQSEAARDGTPSLWLVSGFALGIDRLAHQAALEMGLDTLAFLGGGLDYIGPQANLDLCNLARKKARNFLFLSEFCDDQKPMPWFFPRRNRLIAGLSSRCVVIQAPQKSGAMITARYALDEGREVEAFDHPVLQGMAGANEGARSLIESGAKPIYIEEKHKKIADKDASLLFSVQGDINGKLNGYRYPNPNPNPARG